MPTQRELDELQQRTKAQFGTIGRVYEREGSIQDVSTNAPTENTSNRTDVDSDSNQRAVDEFRPRYGVGALEGGGGGGGSGLPEYPGTAPSLNVKAPLVWDGNNDEARWLQGETQDPTDTNDYIDVFSYDPLPAFDKFSLTRFELRDGVICENGSPVNVKIMLIETP